MEKNIIKTMGDINQRIYGINPFKKDSCKEGSILCNCGNGVMHTCLNCGVDSHYSLCDFCQHKADSMEMEQRSDMEDLAKDNYLER